VTSPKISNPNPKWPLGHLSTQSAHLVHLVEFGSLVTSISNGHTSLHMLQLPQFSPLWNNFSKLILLEGPDKAPIGQRYLHQNLLTIKNIITRTINITNLAPNHMLYENPLVS